MLQIAIEADQIVVSGSEDELEVLAATALEAISDGEASGIVNGHGLRVELIG
jgi:hypothetical protein